MNKNDSSKEFFRLRHHITQFSETIRVGIDLGENTGGMAVVRGSEVIEAITYLDFHKSTLEDRRSIRRGRRTRNSKRKRLSRLRSWIMRQKLPNGERLPDPYKIMHNPEYQTPPGVYKQTAGDPTKADGWIQAASKGETDAAGFVRAVTLIFSKRGYSWDAHGVADMTDTELEEFLKSARVPRDLVEDIKSTIRFRHENTDDPVRGKKKVPPAQLFALLELAAERPRQPRTAEHRRVRRADLEGCVRGMGSVFGLTTDEQNRWIRELSGLLDKRVRKIRFDNRIRSGCSWCGSPTPRKKHIRKNAYFAAIYNLRKQPLGLPATKLDPEDLKVFFEWWEAEKKPSRETIKKRLIKINAQEKMATQLYNLLHNRDLSGRASLCREHIEMAAQGKSMKDCGVDPQTTRKRQQPNPCREQRDARILRLLESLIFINGKTGDSAWKHGPVSFISIEVPEPQAEKKGKQVTGRLKKGEVSERHTKTMRQRLHDEIGGICLYTGEILEPDTAEIEHVYPKSSGGPDLQENLTLTARETNKAKGDQTPYQWFGKDPEHWTAFENRVRAAKMNDRKKIILLNKEDIYPEGNPSPLARAGARWRSLEADIQALFRKYGVEPPTASYVLGKPHIQRVRGSETQRLREAFLNKADGTENFPSKNKFHTFNHAEDAVLAAALPPHTWRPLIWKKKEGNTGDPERPTRLFWHAPPELAPDWNGYVQKSDRPIVRIIGNYSGTWKRNFSKLNFAQIKDGNPDTQAHIRQRIDIKDYKVGTTKLAEGQLQDYIEKCAADAGIEKNKHLTQDAINAVSKRKQGIRRVTAFRAKQGPRIAHIKPSDGPERYVQLEGITEGCIIWKDPEKKRGATQYSRVYSEVAAPFIGGHIDPQIPPNAVILGQLNKYQTIHLPPRGPFAGGFYIVKEFGKSGIEVFPESYYPKSFFSDQENKARIDEAAERKLGKTELEAYFEQRKAERRKQE